MTYPLKGIEVSESQNTDSVDVEARLTNAGALRFPHNHFLVLFSGFF